MDTNENSLTVFENQSWTSVHLIRESIAQCSLALTREMRGNDVLSIFLLIYFCDRQPAAACLFQDSVYTQRSNPVNIKP